MSFMRFQLEECTVYDLFDCEVCMDCYSDEVVIDELIYYPKTQDELGNEVDNRDEFSWSSCDCCGSTLGGARYAMVAMNEGDKGKRGYKWRLSASGYMDCTEWSSADSVYEALRDCLGMHGDGFDEQDFRDLGSHIPGFDDFLEGYLYGLAFTAQTIDEESGESGEPPFGEPGCDIRDCVETDEVWEVLSDEGKLEVLSDCIGFILDCEGMIPEERMHEAGSDFHLTRNGHGAGFWDGDWNNGDELSAKSKPYGSFELMSNGSEWMIVK